MIAVKPTLSDSTKYFDFLSEENSRKMEYNQCGGVSSKRPV